MARHDGGSAFPRAPFEYQSHEGLEWSVREQSGMTLRDWFAGMALTGLPAGDMSRVYSQEHVAITAYEIADCMLAEREKEETS